MAVRIIIADDHQIVRQGLKNLLQKESDMEVVAEAGDGVRIVTLVREFTPDVVIMDVKMPNLNGIEATYQILSEFPDVKIIALSMYNKNGFVTNMLKAGVQGYLLKDCAYEELIQAVRLAMSGKTYLSPSVTEVLVKDYISQDSNPMRSALSELTPREREVLQMIAGGKRTNQIANLLNISVKTVDSHRQQIMFKLRTRSIAELTKFAIREGLTPLEE